MFQVEMEDWVKLVGIQELVDGPRSSNMEVPVQSLLIVGGLCSVGIDLSSVHPENVSNMVAGSNLFLSGALGLNGQIPERLNPL